MDLRPKNLIIFDENTEPGKRVYWQKLREVFDTSWGFLMAGKLD